MPRPPPGDDPELPPDEEPTRPPLRPRPLKPQAPPPAGETPSVTSWTRLEPSCDDTDMQRSIGARIYDPLWMLTRQWQVGEFQGEDAGSPVIARVRAQVAMLSRLHLGTLAPDSPIQVGLYDSEQLPLEVAVERQRVRARSTTESKQLRLAVDAGLHFLHMLAQQPLSRSYREGFVASYSLRLPDGTQLAAMDLETVRFLRTMAGRAVDARLLAAAFRPPGGGAPALDPALQIASGDRAEIEQTGLRWLGWYETLFSESGSDTDGAWIPERLEYAVSVAGRLSLQPLGEKTLTAAELYKGHVDWSDFDVNLEVSMGTQSDRKFRSLVQTTVPAPVSFRGTPAARFWEFEDARIEYGLLPAGPADLAQLLMIEYASSYGNDWFVIPLVLPVGSLTSVNSLVVTDTFGVRTLLRPLGDPALPKPEWSMYQHSVLRRAGSEAKGIERNLFFLAPVLGRSLQSAPVEEVLFMRDEMGNLAWAIERSIEGPLGHSIIRGEASAYEPVTDAQPDKPASSAGGPRYLLSSHVPSHWIPLLPVQLTERQGRVVSRLKRGAVLQPDGSRQVHVAQGALLNTGGPLLLHEEEVPREGVCVARHYQMARWTDGSTFAWMANRKRVGRGEGSSGLRFDSA